MENKPKVTITSWKPGVGAWLNVQENRDGKFGKTEKIFLPGKDLEGMRWDEVLQYATEYVTNGGFVNEPEMIEEPKEDPRHIRRQEEQEIETEIILPSRISLLRKYWFVPAVLVLVPFLTVWANQDSQEEKEAKFQAEHQAEILRLQNEINSLRSEREAQYTQCQQSCENQRTVYDAEVILRKAQLEELSQ